MIRSDTLFGKRDNAMPNSPNTTSNSAGTLMPNTAPAPIKPIPALANTTVNEQTPILPEQVVAPVSSESKDELGSKLIVGPNIKLRGVEISDCDILVVEGLVEANAIKSRVMRIAEGGAFKGSAEVDVAEIHGEFEGDLIALQKLVIVQTGKVSGKVRYGKVVIQEGGQLAGDIQACSSMSTSSGATPRSLMVAKL